jgi:hypothetical protein
MFEQLSSLIRRGIDAIRVLRNAPRYPQPQPVYVVARRRMPPFR